MYAKTNLLRLLLIGLLGATAASVGWGFTFILNTDTGLPVKWPSGQIAMRVMADNTTKLTDGNTRATAIVTAMKDAQRGWNQYLGDEQFAPQIMPVGNGSDGNSINEVFFSNTPYDKKWDTNTLAITTQWSTGNERGEADTIFNTAFTWDSYRGPLTANGAIDIERVALHEFGHNLGLDHPDDAGQSVTAVMNSHVGNVDSLQADDIAGAQSLYGPPGIPVNDNFANAITISLGSTNTTTVTGFNTNATKETGEPNHAGNSGGHSVWWKWSAPADGNVTLDTKGSYSDTTLGVYTGSSVSALTTIASNDDIKDGVIQASSLTFTATGGTTYYFAVDGFNAGAANGGTDSSAITLNLNFTATGSPVPVITAQPASQTIVLGGTASFSVTATTATGTLTYQWNFNGTAIPGATASTYSFASAQASNAGNYSVTVTNSAGSITSSNATLTITAPPPAPPKSSGGGGGGAPSLWFYVGLSLLGFSRRLFRSRR
jgi:hypothetical protein